MMRGRNEEGEFELSRGLGEGGDVGLGGGIWMRGWDGEKVESRKVLVTDASRLARRLGQIGSRVSASRGRCVRVCEAWERWRSSYSRQAIIPRRALSSEHRLSCAE